MTELIHIRNNTTFRDLTNRLMDIQGEVEGRVLSVQPQIGGTIFVGIKGYFEHQDEFEKYLRNNGLPFESVGKNEWSNYFMIKDKVTAEFYKLK